MKAPSAPPGGDFDRIALIYDRLARLVFGARLQTAQACWLEKIPPNGEIAIIGGGSGTILEALASAGCQPSAIYYVEASQQMIALARKQLARLVEQQAKTASIADSVRFIHLHAEDWQPERMVDVLITPFFLDCFEGRYLELIIARLSRCLRPGGQWLITDFTRSTVLHHRLMTALMYRFFRLTCRLSTRRLERFFDLIARSGFKPLAQRDFPTPAGPVRSALMEKVLAPTGNESSREIVIAHE